MIAEGEVDDEGAVAVVWLRVVSFKVGRMEWEDGKGDGLPDLVVKFVALNTVVPRVVVNCLLPAPALLVARMPTYSALELSPLKKNCCFGRFPCPLVVIPVLTMFVCRPSLMAAICA